MSPKQRLVLEALDELTEDDWFPYLTTVAESCGLTHRETRVAARALARQGLAQLVHLFDDSTGLTAGSGYAITPAGRMAAKGARLAT